MITEGKMSRKKGEKSKSKCDCNCIHEDIVSEVRERIAEPNVLDAVSALYKVFGDRTRLNILAH